MDTKKRIIIADDDPAIQDALHMMLEHKGYEVTVLGSGGPLLDGTFTPPHLFILDKQLPGVDGLDICRYLKGRAATKDIPVLILSASPQIREQATAACADEFLEKPFKMQELRQAVERLMG